ncbi:MAG: 1,4-alpha-glucan branching protein domain-containing protein [Verrucomicrobiota bacterium]
MPKGYLSLVLHAHLPYVRHPEYDQFLEEDWLFEAITETYIPLINMMNGLIQDGVDFRLTMSMTPPLCSMLRDGLLQDRYLHHLNHSIELTHKECERTRGDHTFEELAWFYRNRLENSRDVFLRYDKDLVRAFKEFQDQGFLEIITCGATHGFLPMMTDYPEAVRAQILVARDHYKECFGRNPRGIWLPECAYVPGIEDFLQEAEIRWFILDTHGVLFSEPQPRNGVFAPVFTPAGPAAFGRDLESSKQVWSAEEGYPGDGCYRDFYRDVGFDLDFDYVKDYIQPNGLRKFTGLKYYRITGKTAEKEPYQPRVAEERTADHAGNFMFNREKQIEHLSSILGNEPIILSPYDAELFGHWWFEGPSFLNYLLRKTAYDQDTFKMITPSEYLEKFPTQQLVQPCASSWGANGHNEVWVEPSNTWIYPHLHAAAGRMTELARQFHDCYGLTDRAMKQAARELLLAQSSDWAFIMKTGTMVPYAVKRTKDHLIRFNRLYDQIKGNCIDTEFLDNCEWRSPIFPNIDWKYYA